MYLTLGVNLAANQSDCLYKQWSAAKLNKKQLHCFFGSGDYINAWRMLSLDYNHLINSVVV